MEIVWRYVRSFEQPPLRIPVETLLHRRSFNLVKAVAVIRVHVPLIPVLKNPLLLLVLPDAVLAIDASHMLIIVEVVLEVGLQDV